MLIAENGKVLVGKVAAITGAPPSGDHLSDSLKRGTTSKLDLKIGSRRRLHSGL